MVSVVPDHKIDPTGKRLTQHRTIAIGDIHGCSAALDSLLEAISPGQNDTLVIMGDFIDNGIDSKGVITRLIELSSRCHLISIRGNHEEMMIDSLEDKRTFDRWMDHGGEATLMSYGDEGSFELIPEEHVSFVKGTRDHFETPSHFFVHATYLPNLLLAEQSTVTLRWKSLLPDPPHRHFSGKVAVVGHTRQVNGEILDLGHILCIDTNCCGGGWLTGLDVNSGECWRADERDRLREMKHPADWRLPL